MGRHRYGQAFAEWAYIGPQYSEGIERSRLQELNSADQQVVAGTWFMANFEPLSDGGPWFGFASLTGKRSRNIVGFNQGRWAPPCWPAPHLLEEEFAEVIPSLVLNELGRQFEARSAFWYLKTVDDLPALSDADTIVAALNRVASAIEQIETKQPGLGHNQGPTLPVESAAEIQEAVQQARAGLQNKTLNVPAVDSARARLSDALGFVGKEFLKGVVSEAGKQAFLHNGPLLLSLYFALQQAVDAIGQWIVQFLRK